jgi:tRNA1Val (adenine37-N6)-methyltransferase
MSAAPRVRAARRPAGFVPAGPAPAAGPVAADLWPRAGEDLCFLAGDWRILQRRDGHRWSLDDLVTAWFATEHAPRSPRRLADLGCGIGSVLMLLAWRFPEARGVGVEAQDLSVELARRSLRWNDAAERVEVRRGDLRDPTALDADLPFDLVTGTPPYVPLGAGRASDRPQRAPCRLERRGGVEDYCAAAARILAPGGVFVTCAGAGQARRVEAGARAAGLAIARRRDIVPRQGKNPLFAVYAMRGDAGEDVVEPPLVVRDGDGRRTAQFVALRAAMGMPP